MYKLLAILSIGIMCSSASALEWSYQGYTSPAHWGKLSDQYVTCQNGHFQSPIDIENAQKKALPQLQIEYGEIFLKFLPNPRGISIEVENAGGFGWQRRQYYVLQKLHIHQPSEEVFYGKRYPMNMHFVHQDKHGQLAVIAVQVEPGKFSPALDVIIKGLQHPQATESMLDLAAFLPVDQHYYTYKGSLTTPPCAEGVNWYIFRTPIQASPEQLKALSHYHYGNARPEQKIDQQTVYRSF